MIVCAEGTCRYCFKDYRGLTICNHECPVLNRIEGTQHGFLKCMTYKARADEKGIPELQPGRGEDGLYPGQIRR